MIQICVSHKLISLFHGDRDSFAVITDIEAESRVRKEGRIVVDLLDGEDHCFSVTETDRKEISTSILRVLVVQYVQSAENDVS